MDWQMRLQHAGQQVGTLGARTITIRIGRDSVTIDRPDWSAGPERVIGRGERLAVLVRRGQLDVYVAIAGRRRRLVRMRLAAGVYERLRREVCRDLRPVWAQPRQTILRDRATWSLN